jgi:4-alpha-glucanotransferase
VNYRAEELYAILCLESHRYQTTLVGENLGTVPPEVSESMARHGLRTMYVVPFEQRPDPKRALRTPPPACVASLNTHDMPTWAAQWNAHDIDDRRDLGLMNARAAAAERKQRAKAARALARFLRHKGFLDGKADARSVLRALLKFLGRSEAELVLVNAEDLWLELEPQNTPGTTTERVNWRRKARLPLEQWLARDDVRDLLETLSRARAKSERQPEPARLLRAAGRDGRSAAR